MTEYELTVTAHKVVYVDAEDEDEAVEKAKKKAPHPWSVEKTTLEAEKVDGAWEATQ